MATTQADSLSVKITAQTAQANRSINKLIVSLQNLKTTLGGVVTVNTGTFNTVNNTIKNTATNTELAAVNTKKASKSLKEYFSNANKANKSTKSLAASIGKFYATWFLAIRGIKGLMKNIQSSMDYVETYNYFSVTMSKLGKDMALKNGEIGKESAEAYAENFTSQLNELTRKMTGYQVDKFGSLNLTNSVGLGLDPNEMMNFEAKISAITNSLGLMGQTSVNTAKALTMLSGDLSSLTNRDLEDVQTNLNAMLIGQARAGYQYGFDLTNASLQVKATSLGIAKSVSEMTQAEKAQLRLLSLLDQSRVAWGDEANTINSASNQYRVLKQQMSNLGRVMGNLFLPIVQKVLPAVNGLVIAMNRLFTSLGMKMWGDSWLKSLQDGISGGTIEDDLEDIGDDAEDTAAKIKKMSDNLQGFDEINKLSSNDNTKTTGTGLGLNDIDLSNEIQDALNEYEKVWNAALERSENRIEKYADKFSDALKPIKNIIIDLFDGQYLSAGETAGKLATNIQTRFNNALNKIKWAEIGTNAAKFLNGALSKLDGKKYAEGANKLVSGMWNTVYNFMETFDFGNLEKLIGDSIKNLDWDGISKNAYISGATSAKFAMNMLKMLTTAVSSVKWSAVGDSIANYLNGVLDNISGKDIAEGINAFVNAIWSTFSAFMKKFDFSGVVKVIGDTLKNLDWGTIAQIGLTVGAGKLATSICGDLVTGFTSAFKKAAKSTTKATTELGSSLGTSIVSALKSPLMLIPAAIGAALLAVNNDVEKGYQNLLDEWEFRNRNRATEAATKIGEDIQKVADSASDKLEESITKYNNAISNNQGDIAYIQNLAEQYFKLLDKQSKTNDEITKMEGLYDTLVTKFPELKNVLDNTAGGIDGQRKALEEYVKELDKKIKLEAAQTGLQEQYQNLYTVQQKILASQDKYNKLKAEYYSANKNYTAAKQALKDLENFRKNASVDELYDTDGKLKELQKRERELYEIMDKAHDSYFAVRDPFEELKEQEKEIQNSIDFYNKAITESYTSATEIIKTETEKQKKIVNNGQIVMAEGWDKIPNEVKKQITNSATNLNNGLSYMENKKDNVISSYLVKGWDKIPSSVQNAMKQNSSVWGEGLSDLATKKNTAISSYLVKGWDKIPSSVKTAISNINPDYSNLINKTDAAGKTVYTTFSQKWMSGTNGNNISTAFTNGLVKYTGVVSKSGDVAKGAYNKFSVDYLSSKNGETIGQNFVTGLYNGLTVQESWKMINEAIAKNAVGVPLAITKPWEIHSPSKLTEKIGKYFVEGLYNGISDWSSIDKEVTSMANSVVDTTQNTLNGMDLGTMNMNGNVNMSGMIFDAVANALEIKGQTEINLGGVYVGDTQLTDVVVKDIRKQTIATGVNPVINI